MRELRCAGDATARRDGFDDCTERACTCARVRGQRAPAFAARGVVTMLDRHLGRLGDLVAETLHRSEDPARRVLGMVVSENSTC